LKNLKDFLSSKEVKTTVSVNENETVVEPIVLNVIEQPDLDLWEEGKNKQHPMDPPAVLIMKRKSIRQFPNNQRVALYYVDKIDKYVTVPYTSMQWSASPSEEVEYSGEVIGENVISQLKNIVEDGSYDRVQFEDGKRLMVTVELAEIILKVYNVLNESNKKQLAEMSNKSKEQFGKVVDFALKHLK